MLPRPSHLSWPLIVTGALLVVAPTPARAHGIGSEAANTSVLEFIPIRMTPAQHLAGHHSVRNLPRQLGALWRMSVGGAKVRRSLQAQLDHAAASEIPVAFAIATMFSAGDDGCGRSRSKIAPTMVPMIGIHTGMNMKANIGKQAASALPMTELLGA